MAIHLRHIKIDNEHVFELQLQRLIKIFFEFLSNEKNLLVLLMTSFQLVVFFCHNKLKRVKTELILLQHAIDRIPDTCGSRFGDGIFIG